MCKTPVMRIYESTFAQSDKTDAILIVEGKKLHVSKAVLSFHSDYFDALFNADFMEKSMPEISIGDVDFEDFAAVLSLILKNPISPTEENAEKLLELSDRFLLPAAKRHVEFFLISTGFDAFKKLEIASKYDSDTLLSHALKLFKTKEELVPKEEFSEFPEKVKAKILDRLIELNKLGLTGPSEFGSSSFVGFRSVIGDRLNLQMSSISTRPLLKFPIDIRAFMLYDAYQRYSTKKSYKNYEKLCEVLGEEAISFEEYESLFNQYLEEDERDHPIPDIRGCILSDVTNGKAAETSFDDLCDAFKYYKIDKEDHDYWYNRFDSGLLFSLVTFSDFPEDVIAEIVGKCDIKSYLNLRSVSRALQTVIDHLAPPCSVIQVNYGETGLQIYVDGALVDSHYFEPPNSNHPTEAIEKRILPGMLSLLLRNPKLRLKWFGVHMYFGLPENLLRARNRIETTPRQYGGLLFNLLESLKLKIHVKNCSIRVVHEKELFEILQCFKPGTLESISLSKDFPCDIDNQIVEMDQWKEAKHLVLDLFDLPSINHLLHFSTIESRTIKAKFPLEEVVKICKSIPIWTNFEHIKIGTCDALDFETIKKELNLQPTASPRIFSIPNTNSVIQFDPAWYSYSLEITKK
ncbi:hypothetical protein CRE_11435 [Caenorhabditis remanei]|uniref:F-box domain-containing protein n=1 Tax=Caenorhabditis remanei TaxID=31234 RepID=E3NBG6_CAERE|nr:hypothetical protein CRE_11435 [Caenorhabditis remanei]